MAGSSTWKTDRHPGPTTASFSFSPIVQRQRASTGSVYNGGTDSTYTFEPSAKDRTVKGSRNPHSRGVKSGGRLYYRGNVDPGWGRKPVTIQKKNCKSCGWHAYKTVRTSRTGGYSARIYAPSSGRLVLPLDREGHLADVREGHGGTIYTYRARAARGAGAGIGH